jgi:hypothetical protein
MEWFATTFPDTTCLETGKLFGNGHSRATARHQQLLRTELVSQCQLAGPSHENYLSHENINIFFKNRTVCIFLLSDMLTALSSYLVLQSTCTYCTTTYPLISCFVDIYIVHCQRIFVIVFCCSSLFFSEDLWNQMYHVLLVFFSSV